MKLEELLKEFDKLMGVPKELENFKGQSCFICGQPYDKAPQVTYLRSLLTKAYEAGRENTYGELGIPHTPHDWHHQFVGGAVCEKCGVHAPEPQWKGEGMDRKLHVDNVWVSNCLGESK